MAYRLLRARSRTSVGLLALVLLVLPTCVSPLGDAVANDGLTTEASAAATVTSKPEVERSTPVPTSGDRSTLDAAGLDALEVLSTLTVEPPHLGSPTYNRNQWPHWLDLDGDGCDTRDEVLLDEAVVRPAVSGRCTVVGGRWYSTYDGVATSDPSTFDIDHVVALAEVDRSGGWAWDAAKKAAYANDVSDPRTLAAVTATSNRSKSDQDPAGWLPALDVCGYVGDWIAIKARWRLSVDAEEATKLSDLILGPCAGLIVAPWPEMPTGPKATSAASTPPPGRS